LCIRCSRLAVKDGRCQIHQRLPRQKYVQHDRDNRWLKMYKTKMWQQLRDAQLRREPMCVECKRWYRLTPATVADHIVPHKGDPKLFYDPENLQSLCASCHSRKTNQEDGGYGNREKTP
jgi:5-methylcytosine-specific restriction protein A